MGAANSNRFVDAEPGADWRTLDTPCLIVDLDILEANINNMADFLAAHDTQCRPHFKGHMCLGIADKQMAAGAIGLCAAKISAAEVLVDHGISDVLLANQVIGRSKIARLLRLRKRAEVRVVVDEPQNVRDLSEAASGAGMNLGVLVEIRVRSKDSTFAKGYTRNGANTPEKAVELAKQIDGAPGLSFEGMMAYEGPHPRIKDPEQRKAAIMRDLGNLFRSLELLEAAGLPCEIVSAGGTGTYKITGALECVTELQPGSYPVMNTMKCHHVKDFSQSLFIAAMVMGRPDPGTAILDVGMKSLKMSKQDTTEEDLDRPPVVSVEGAQLHHLSEEHAAMSVAGDARELRAGDKVLIAPSYGAPTINYHDRIHAVRNGLLEETWDVAARGCSQ